jgi:hypothetical protein
LIDKRKSNIYISPIESSKLYSAIASVSPPSNSLPITSTLARDRKPNSAIAELVGTHYAQKFFEASDRLKTTKVEASTLLIMTYDQGILENTA